MYSEIDVVKLGKGGSKEEITISRDSISYYRSFIPVSDEGKNLPVTMVYLKGSEKALRISSTHDAFKRKVGANVIDVSYLAEEKIEKLKEFIVKLKEE